MIQTAKYLDRQFHWKNYNCWDFIREIWLDHCGVDLGQRTPEDTTIVAHRDAFYKQWDEVHNKIVHELPGPADPCLVLMLRPKVLSHVGVHTKGNIIHLHPRMGVLVQDVRSATQGFPEIKWYA